MRTEHHETSTDTDQSAADESRAGDGLQVGGGGAFGRQINYDRSAGLARSQRRAECAMRVCRRGEDVSEACLRMRTAARAQRGVVLTCACRGRLLCIRWAGGILEVADVRRERRKIDVGSILMSYMNLAC